MESETIIKAFLCQVNKIMDSIGRILSEQFQVIVPFSVSIMARVIISPCLWDSRLCGGSNRCDATYQQNFIISVARKPSLRPNTNLDNSQVSGISTLPSAEEVKPLDRSAAQLVQFEIRSSLELPSQGNYGHSFLRLGFAASWLHLLDLIGRVGSQRLLIDALSSPQWNLLSFLTSSFCLALGCW